MAFSNSYHMVESNTKYLICTPYIIKFPYTQPAALAVILSKLGLSFFKKSDSIYL